MTASPASLSWQDMTRQDFDRAEPLTLFEIPDQSAQARKPDKFGTEDLFGSLES